MTLIQRRQTQPPCKTTTRKQIAMTNENLVSQPFMEHLIEFRNRVLRAVASVAVIFIGLISFSNELYLYVSEPLRKYLPESSSMIATDVASPFLTPFKLTLVLSMFAAMPYILFQIWAFVAPGLYQREKRIVIPLFCSSVLLFYAGMAFAYYIVFPLVFMFFTSVGPEGVAIMTDIRSYLDFVLKLFLPLGSVLKFQLRWSSSRGWALSIPIALRRKGLTCLYFALCSVCC